MSDADNSASKAPVFKKPTLMIGKVGKLPRKLETTSTTFSQEKRELNEDLKEISKELNEDKCVEEEGDSVVETKGLCV